jgi:hypothetical protein
LRFTMRYGFDHGAFQWSEMSDLETDVHAISVVRGTISRKTVILGKFIHRAANLLKS